MSYPTMEGLDPHPVSIGFVPLDELICAATIKAALPGFVGNYVLHAVGAYCIKELTIVGIANTLEIYGLGTNTAGTSGASVVLDGVSFYFFDECVSFGPEYEHPLAVDYDRVYCQFFMRAGINLGGLSGTASSGESNFDFGRITVTNAGQPRTEYVAAVEVNTPSTSFDRITWTGVVPTYGFVVMRSADGLTNWIVVPNWAAYYYPSLSFDAAKTIGETWYYKVVPNTVGLLVHRAKAISGGSIQTEYVGIGQLYKDVRGVCINSVYYEIRSETIPPPMLCAVYGVVAENVTINSGWVEKSAYAVIGNGNGTMDINNIRCSGLSVAAIGEVDSTDLNLTYSNIDGASLVYARITGNTNISYYGKEYTSSTNELKLSHKINPKRSLLYRGVEKSAWQYNITDGGVISGVNSIAVIPLSKTKIVPVVQGGSYSTVLTSAVATPVFSFSVVPSLKPSLTIHSLVRGIGSISFDSTQCQDFCDGRNMIGDIHKERFARTWIPIHKNGKMKYHTSWDWLVPVYRKIGELGFNYKISNSTMAIYDETYRMNAVGMMFTNNSHEGILSAFKTVIDFIYYHNKNKGR